MGSDSDALAELLAGYQDDVVTEGANANAVRSQISMDGTLADFSEAGGALEFTYNLASSLGIEAS